MLQIPLRKLDELKPRPAAGGNGVDLIAEPWGLGGNSYQVGGFPTGWSEWNDHYRDAMRMAQNRLGVAPVSVATLATRFSGSSDLYQNNDRRPWNSVNFIVAHDGFLFFHDTNQPRMFPGLATIEASIQARGLPIRYVTCCNGARSVEGQKLPQAMRARAATRRKRMRARLT